MKIKNVSIQAFKSYLLSGDGFFDFEIEKGLDKKEIADFISLYAPNGFGKTSFYDAVDYAVTNNVSRYVRGSRAKNNAYQNLETGSRYVLRNKDADDYESEFDTSLPTRLSVVTTKKTYDNEVKKPKGNQKADYLSNRQKPTNDPTPKTNFMQRVLLSQEAIDAFLRESNPQERFEEFINNSDGKLSSYFSQREIIRKQCNYIDKAISKIKDKISIKTKEVDELDGFNSPFTEVNEIIEDLNSLDLYQIKKFSNPFSQNDYEALTNDILVLQEKLKEHINSSINYKLKLSDEFLSNRDVISEYLEELNILTNRFNNAKILFNKVEEKEVLNQRIRENHGLISVANNDLDIKRKALGQIQPYLKVKREIIDVKSFIDKLNKSLEVKKKESSSVNKTLSECNFSYSKLNEQLSDLITSKNESEKYFADIELLEQNISIDRSETREVIERINTNKLVLKELELNINDVEGFDINKSIYIKFEWAEKCKAVSVMLNHLYQRYKKLNEDIKLKENELTNFKKEIEKTEIQSSLIAKLVNQASEIINKSKQTDCPVCNHQYSSFEHLQNSLLSNDELNQHQKSLRVFYDKSFFEVTQLREQLLNCENQYRNQKDQLLNEIKEKASNFTGLVESDNALLTNKESSIKSRNEQLSGLKLKTEFSSKQEFNKTLDFKIKNCNQLISEIDEQKKELLEKLHLLNIELSDLNKKLSNEYQKLNVIEEDKTQFEDLSNIFEEFGVNTDLNAGELKILIQKEINIKEELLESIIDLNKTLKANFDLLDLDYPDTLSSVESSIKLYREKLESKRHDFSKYLVVFKTFSIDPPKDLHSLEKATHDLMHKKEALKNEGSLYNSHLSNCRILFSMAEQALKFSKVESLKADLYNLEKDLGKHKNLSAPLEKDLESINKYIQKKANEFFNTKLINQLYQSIEPHPDFREIHFECKLIDKSRGELNIFAFDPEKNKKSAPNLTFSSAQINVLSLSIFLARALTTKDDNGENVDCIFIDDPIQSMDSINVLSLIDLLRNLVVNFGKQIIISTHDENFYELLKRKIPTGLFKSKYLRLESFGKVIEEPLLRSYQKSTI